MNSAKEILEKHTIIVLNEAIKHGFAQIPRYILRDKRLSFGARLTYAVLLSYAWQEDSCFPGQNKIATDLGVSRRMISPYLNELREQKYIAWERRGLGKTNVYYILDYQPLEIEADVKHSSHLDGKQVEHLVGKYRVHKYKQVNKLRGIKTA
jgi:Helix-turn-helix domain